MLFYHDNFLSVFQQLTSFMETGKFKCIFTFRLPWEKLLANICHFAPEELRAALETLYFNVHFLNRKYLHFDSNFIKYNSSGSSQQVNIGLSLSLQTLPERIMIHNQPLTLTQAEDVKYKVRQFANVTESTMSVQCWSKQDKMADFSQTLYSNIFSSMYFDQDLIEVCSQGSNWQEVTIGWLDNGLVRFRWQTIILTHWGRVTHICISKLTIIGSVNGLSPGRRQAIIWTNAGILLIGPLGTNLSEILIEIYTFSFKNVVWEMAAILSRPQCVNHYCSQGFKWQWLKHGQDNGFTLFRKQVII